jgi:hypothetical protein
MELVIGGDLRSFLYALESDRHLLYVRPQLPSLIDVDIPIANDFYAPTYLWKCLYFYLAVNGKLLFSDKIDNVRLAEEHLHVFTKRARKYTETFSHLTLFDDYGVQGIPPHLEKKEQPLLEVRDWFNVRSGMRHDHKEIEGDSDFVKKIIFYPSPRIDGNHDLKDAVSFSYLPRETLDSHEYSDISARFKTIAMMKASGIRGARNGRDTLNKERYKYYAVRLENAHREVVTPMKPYRSTEIYTFKYDSLFDIIKDMRDPTHLERLLKHI